MTRKARKVQALVIGGGPSGLAVAYALQGDTVVLEKESKVGGLCRSIRHGEGVFDIGGHSFHTPHPDVDELVRELLGKPLFEQRRDARVYSHGTLIPYPFQRYFDRLPDAEVVHQCEAGLHEASSDGPPPENFEEYIVRKFGRGIAEHFMLPYNRKLWAREVSEISCEWTSERVASPKGKTETFDTAGEKRKPLQPDTLVGYPATGGFEEIYRAFVPRIPRLEVNSEVTRIDPVRKTAVMGNGRTVEWEFLVSTIPLPVLTRIVEGTPADIREMAESLDFLSLRVELLLTGRQLESTIQRIYTAEPDIPAHKIALNHNSSDELRSRPQHAIMAEVSLGPEKRVEVGRIAPRTVDFLCELGILESPREVAWRSHVDVRFGYPVYTHERPELVAGVKKWMRQRDIHTVGRFGDWEYVNSDRCVMKGLSLGRELRELYPPLAPSTRRTATVEAAEQPRVDRAILLLAGRGKRLGSLTSDQPKCMVEVGETPILERSLRALSTNGVSEVVMVVGYRQEEVRAFAGQRFDGMRIRYVVNERHSETNTAYSLWLARKFLDGHVLLLEGDIVFDADAIRRILGSAAEESVWAGVAVKPGRDEGILLAPDSQKRLERVELIREPQSRGEDLTHKCAGIQFLSPAASMTFRAKLEEAVSCGRVSTYADLVLGTSLRELPVRLCDLKGLPWAEVDDLQDLRRARHIFNGRPPTSPR